MTDILQAKAPDSSPLLDECPPRRECQYGCRHFSDWTELSSYMREFHQLEAVLIGLQACPYGSNPVRAMDAMVVAEDSRGSVLISMPLGRGVLVSIRLIATQAQALEGGQWKPVADYPYLLLCAKSVYQRAVRDQVVELMSANDRGAVVSLFLDREGKVESASTHAREFCERSFFGSDRASDFLPPEQSRYLKACIDLHEEEEARLYKQESLIFTFREGAGLVDCLLQKMGGKGYLLCLSRGRQAIGPL